MCLPVKCPAQGPEPSPGGLSFQPQFSSSHNLGNKSQELPKTVQFLKNWKTPSSLMMQTLKSVLLRGSNFLPVFSPCGLDLQTGSLQLSFLTDLLLQPRAMFSSLTNLTTASFLRAPALMKRSFAACAVMISNTQ